MLAHICLRSPKSTEVASDVIFDQNVRKIRPTHQAGRFQVMWGTIGAGSVTGVVFYY